jgi:hypothetical protein
VSFPGPFVAMALLAAARMSSALVCWVATE